MAPFPPITAKARWEPPTSTLWGCLQSISIPIQVMSEKAYLGTKIFIPSNWLWSLLFTPWYQGRSDEKPGLSPHSIIMNHSPSVLFRCCQERPSEELRIESKSFYTNVYSCTTHNSKKSGNKPRVYQLTNGETECGIFMQWNIFSHKKGIKD